MIGGCNRGKSEEWGLKVFLCRRCHNMMHNPRTEVEQIAQDFLKQVAQEEFEKRYSHTLFMQEFGKNYLQEGEENESMRTHGEIDKRSRDKER